MIAAATASAQGLVETNLNIIAKSGDAAPGVPGATFDTGTFSFGDGVLDASGKVLFSGQFSGPGVTSANSYAFFHGSSPSNLTLVLRAADPEPSGSMPGVMLATPGGLSTFARMSRSGTMLFASGLSPALASEDTAWFSGTPGSLSLFVREGMAAPGIGGGVVLSTSFSKINPASGAAYANCGMNNNGFAFFLSNLAGPGVTVANGEAMFAGTAGSLSLVARRGDTVFSGETIADLNPAGQVNSANQLVFEAQYSVGSGVPPVTTASDWALLVYTPGSGLAELIRDGDPVAGMSGVTYARTSFPGLPFRMSNNGFNSSGEIVMTADTSSGGTVLAKVGPSGDTVVFASGDPVPGAPGVTFASFDSASAPTLSDTGVVAFIGRLGGAATISNDCALLSNANGSFEVVAREGGIAPGTPGWTFAEPSVAPIMNSAGRLVFRVTLLTGGSPSSVTSLWSWDPATGLDLIAYFGTGVGSTVEYSPGVFKTLSNAFTPTWYGNGDDGALSFAGDGALALGLTFSDNTRAMTTLDLSPASTPTVYCTAGTSTNGCVPQIGATGSPSIAATSGFVIDVTGVEGQKQGLLFYGINGRKSSTWGAGGTSFLCVKAPTQRMGVQLSGGTIDTCDGVLSEDWLNFLATHPGALGNPFSAGQVVNAQGWYRDPPAVKTTNLSDGLEFTTLP